jgi:hypothetical protein
MALPPLLRGRASEPPFPPLPPLPIPCSCPSFFVITRLSFFVFVALSLPSCVEWRPPHPARPNHPHPKMPLSPSPSPSLSCVVCECASLKTLKAATTTPKTSRGNPARPQNAISRPHAPDTRSLSNTSNTPNTTLFPAAVLCLLCRSYSAAAAPAPLCIQKGGGGRHQPLISHGEKGQPTHPPSIVLYIHPITPPTPITHPSHHPPSLAR